MHGSTARLLVVAHGTASSLGAATTARLLDAVRAVRPDHPVELCFLDVVSPRLPDALAAPGPTVVVPLLLSTGYHVQSDIPAAAADRPDTVIARHLGPHPLLVDALVDRLGPVPADATVVLVGAGSTRSGARTELDETARLLADRLGVGVAVHTLADDLTTALAGATHVATYLLAEGQFVTTLAERAPARCRVADPIGVHPALVELVWRRFDEALRGVG